MENLSFGDNHEHIKICNLMATDGIIMIRFNDIFSYLNEKEDAYLTFKNKANYMFNFIEKYLADHGLNKDLVYLVFGSKLKPFYNYYKSRCGLQKSGSFIIRHVDCLYGIDSILYETPTGNLSDYYITIKEKNRHLKQFLNEYYGHKQYFDTDSISDADLDCDATISKGMIKFLELWDNIKKPKELVSKGELTRMGFTIERVIFNDPATIVYWVDGEKTVVKCNGEKFDPEKGLAMAICKKVMGNKGNYYDFFRKYLPIEEIKNEPKIKKINSEDLAGKNVVRHVTGDSSNNGPKSTLCNAYVTVSTSEAAKHFNTTITDIRKKCKEGYFPGAKKIKGKWWVPMPLNESLE